MYKVHVIIDVWLGLGPEISSILEALTWVTALGLEALAMVTALRLDALIRLWPLSWPYYWSKTSRKISIE